MNIDKLQTLDKLSLDKARETAIGLIAKKTKPLVRNRLEYDINSARNSAEVSRIMWQVYLSGNGLGTVGSSWKSFYRSA
jgi:hypothetical protein